VSALRAAHRASRYRLRAGLTDHGALPAPATGRPPVVDSKGHVYYFTANGWTHGCTGNADPYWTAVSCTPGQPKPAGYFAESLVKLDPANSLALVGSWTPATWCELDLVDNDLGGSGPALIEFTLAGGTTRTFAVGGGKEGRLYSIDVDLVTHPDMVEGQPVTALRGAFPVVSIAPSIPCPLGHPMPGDPHHIMGGPVTLYLTSGGWGHTYHATNNIGYHFHRCRRLGILNPIRIC
jgi:hypothetical protein